MDIINYSTERQYVNKLLSDSEMDIKNFVGTVKTVKYVNNFTLSNLIF